MELNLDELNQLHKLKSALSVVAERAKKDARCDDEDFMADDYAGGNIDDAYAAGVDDGEILFARQIMELLK